MLEVNVIGSYCSYDTTHRNAFYTCLLNYQSDVYALQLLIIVDLVLGKCHMLVFHEGVT